MKYEARCTVHEARGTNHEARILVMAMMVLGSSVALAMPTQQELKKAQPLVAELMAPTMDDFKSKKKTAAEVADVAVKYAGEAETEAVKFMLYRSSVPYYVRGEAYDKAADAVEQMKANVKDVPASVIEEIISKATVRATAKKAPRLFELYRQAKAQSVAEKDVAAFRAKLRKNPGSLPTLRNLAEALATSGDWDAALKEFAKLKDGAAQMAKKELDGSAKSAELGEFWWSYKPTYENADDVFEMHAAVHYRKALAAGEITGLKKNIVEQRIAKYGEAAVVAAAGQGASPRTPAATGLYCVIDLSGGPDAKKYQVSYLNDMPKDGWSDEYKTTKLVLRRVEPGTFMMGERDHRHREKVDKPFYIGVFEVTQKQWALVIGNRPSFWQGSQWGVRPVEQVTVEMIRGSSSAQTNLIGAESFIGRLREKSGVDFDLPTETLWEYACRAGATSDYFNGLDCTRYEKDSAVDQIGRYQHNGGWNADKWGGKFKWKMDKVDRNWGVENGSAVVGSYTANDWGLFDTHGNVYEICLFAENRKDGRKGVAIALGGAWFSHAADCKASSATEVGSGYSGFGIGFRLCLPLTGGAAASAPTTTPTTGSIELKTGGNSPFTVKGNEATLELKNGAKLEFVKCPSGWVKVVDDYENNTVRKVKITRPFWIMKQGLRNDDVIGRAIGKWGTHHGFIEPNQEERDKFCSDLTDELKGVLPRGYVVRPPSLVEWEYAYHAGDEDPGSEPFGSLLKFHDWSTFDTHKGTSPVNKWGLHDFHVAEQIFDRVDDSGRAAVKVNKKDKKNISKLPDAQSDKDVFFWSDDCDSASYLVRWPTGCALELKPKNSRTGFVRLVIGPDLVSEWKAKNGKK